MSTLAHTPFTTSTLLVLFGVPCGMLALLGLVAWATHARIRAAQRADAEVALRFRAAPRRARSRTKLGSLDGCLEDEDDDAGDAVLLVSVRTGADVQIVLTPATPERRRGAGGRVGVFWA